MKRFQSQIIIAFLLIFLFLFTLGFVIRMSVSDIILLVGILLSSVTVVIKIVEYLQTIPYLKIEISDGYCFYSEQDPLVLGNRIFPLDDKIYFNAYLDLIITNTSSLPCYITTLNIQTSDNKNYIAPEFYQERKFHTSSVNVSSHLLTEAQAFAHYSYPIRLEAFESIIIGFHITNWELICNDSFLIHAQLAQKPILREWKAGLPYYDQVLQKMIRNIKIDKEDNN